MGLRLGLGSGGCAPSAAGRGSGVGLRLGDVASCSGAGCGQGTSCVAGADRAGTVSGGCRGGVFCGGGGGGTPSTSLIGLPVGLLLRLLGGGEPSVVPEHGRILSTAALGCTSSR